MWRDYIGLLPATAAIINGFIAVIVAQFFKDHHKAKIVLVVMAGLLGVVKSVQLSMHSIRSLSAKQLRKRRELQSAKSSACLYQKATT
jgi:hypothetical protein